MKKIKYVQLEPAEVLLDFHNSRMTAEQFGCYWLIILQLYHDNGKLPNDIEELKMLCKSPDDFQKIWKKIGLKFQKRKNFLVHKRVTNELRSAKQRLKVASDKGLKGAQARWLGHGTGNAKAIAKESEVNENESKVSKVKRSEITERKAISNAGIVEQDAQLHQAISPARRRIDTSRSEKSLSDCLSSISPRFPDSKEPKTPSMQSEILRFCDTLWKTIPPKSVSDRTAYRNMANWLGRGINDGTFNGDMFDVVLDMAGEIAADPKAMNQAAILTARLKSELNYRP